MRDRLGTTKNGAVPLNWHHGSLLLNLIFLMILVWKFSSSGVENSSSSRRLQIAPAALSRTDVDHDELKSVLRLGAAAGLSEEATKKLLLAILEANVPAQKPYEYWKATGVREAEELIVAYEAAQNIRQTLRELFGSGAQDDPAFATAFRPYDRKLPMLPSAKQLEMESLHIASLKRATTARSIETAMSTNAPTKLAKAENVPSIQTILTDHEFFEYQVRESYSARLLANTDFDFTEQQFRDVFRILLEDAKTASSAGRAPTVVAMSGIGASDEVMAKIETALGPSRFAEYKRSKDPVYRALASVAQPSRISHAAVKMAYQLIIDDQRAQQVNSAPRSQPRSDTPVWNPPSIETTRKLRSLLGDEAVGVVYRKLQLYRSAGIPGGVPVREHVVQAKPAAESMTGRVQ